MLSTKEEIITIEELSMYSNLCQDNIKNIFKQYSCSHDVDELVSLVCKENSSMYAHIISCLKGMQKSTGSIDSNVITLEELEEYSEQYNANVQEFIHNSSCSSDVKTLIDLICQQECYMHSYILSCINGMQK